MNDQELLALSEHEFYGMVNSAFLKFNDLFALAHSPLAGSSLVAAAVVPDEVPMVPVDLGRALQTALTWAVARMAPSPPEHRFGAPRPAADPTWQQPAWWRYNILRHNYIEPLLPDKQAGESRRVDALLRRMSIDSVYRYYRLRSSAVQEAAHIIRLALLGQIPFSDLGYVAIANFYSSLRLPESARRLLEIAAVFRGSVLQECLEQMARGEGFALSGAEVSKLIEQRLFILEGVPAAYRVPVRLRQFLSDQPSSDTIKRRHARAAQYWEERRTWPEAIWHHFQAEQYANIVTAIPENIAKLDIQNLKILGEILDKIPENCLTAKELAWWHAGRGYCALISRAANPGFTIPSDMIRLAEFPDSHGIALTWLAFYYYARDPHLALHFLDQALQIMSPGAEYWKVAITRKAQLLNFLLKPHEARVCILEALDSGTLTELEELGTAFLALAESCLMLKEFDAALRHAERALDHWRERGNPYFIARTQFLLSAVHEARGDIESGLTLAQTALAAFRQLAFMAGVIPSLLRIASALVLANKPDEGEAAMRESLALVEQTDKPLTQFNVRFHAAKFYAELGDVGSATAHWAAAYTLARQMGDKDCEQRLVTLREMTPALEDIQAPEHLERATQIARELLKEQTPVTPETLAAQAFVSRPRAKLILDGLSVGENRA